jgi:hypothetical protein
MLRMSLAGGNDDRILERKILSFWKPMIGWPLEIQGWRW